MTDVVIAKAILEAGLWPGAWEKANEVERNDALFKARAALAALNEAGYVVERKAKEPENDDYALRVAEYYGGSY